MPGLLGLSVGLLLAGQAFAQENVVFYETEDPGEYKGLDLWGFDTAWLWDANVIRGVNFLGRERTDVIRFSFTGDTPLADTDGDGINDELTGSGLDEFNFRLWIVNNFTDAHTTLYLNNDTESLDPYFQGPGGPGDRNPETWA